MGPARGVRGHAAGVRHMFMTWSDRSDMQRKAACQEDAPDEAGQALPARLILLWGRKPCSIQNKNVTETK